VHVATPQDPATARKNQTFYAFWLQSVVGSYVHALQLERETLSKSGKSGGKMLWFTILPFVFCGLLMIGSYLWVGQWLWQIPVFFFLQSFFAFTLLELVNYVEHYGMARRELAPGKYERVNPLHSWNASHLVSNFFLFQLQRHSDHHYNAIKRYQVLDHYEESPQLPYGYPTMILMALLPPLWFSLMNPRLQEWQHKNHTFSATAV
jgi:alkane 1-monooxygenase